MRHETKLRSRQVRRENRRPKVVEGIDDETTKGIAGSYKGNPASLTCVPRRKQPDEEKDASVDVMAKWLQERTGTKPEQAHDLALHTISSGIGWLCTFRKGDKDLMAVQVDLH